MPFVLSALQPVLTQSTPSNPTGTSNTTGLMMGLNQSITPQITGRLLVIICGNISNGTGTAGNGGKVQIRYGTGSAPANAAALTGTTAGNQVSSVLERATANDPQCFMCMAIITGLTAATTYWIDVALAAIVAGTTSITNLSFIAMEI